MLYLYVRYLSKYTKILFTFNLMFLTEQLSKNEHYNINNIIKTKFCISLLHPAVTAEITSVITEHHRAALLPH